MGPLLTPPLPLPLFTGAVTGRMSRAFGVLESASAPIYIYIYMVCIAVRVAVHVAVCDAVRVAVCVAAE